MAVAGFRLTSSATLTKRETKPIISTAVIWIRSTTYRVPISVARSWWRVRSISMLSPGMIYDGDETLLRSKRHNAYHLALRVGCTFRPLHSTRNVRGTHEYLRLVGLRERRVTTTCHHGQTPKTITSSSMTHPHPSSRPVLQMSTVFSQMTFVTLT